MANGRIDVYFHEGGKSSNKNAGDKKSEDKNELEHQAIMHQVVNYAKQTVIESVNTFSNFTGSYKAQRLVSGAANVAAVGVMLSQFPVGTIAAGISLVSQGVGQILDTIQADRQSALLLKRSGNEATNESGHS